MKRFMYFSVSVLCLAVAALIGFYIGSNRVEAQSSSPIVGYSNWNANQHYVILENGDVYSRMHNYIPGTGYCWYEDAPIYYGNIWDGAVSTDQSTWGDIKSLKK